MQILSKSNLTNLGIFFTIAMGIIFPAPEQIKHAIPFLLAALLIFIPLVISRVIKLNGLVLSASQKFFSYYTPIGFLLVIFAAVASSSAQLRNLDLKTLAIMLLYVAVLAAVNFTVGFSLSKNLKVRKALAVSFGHKNTSLAIWVGIANFNTAVVMPMVSYIIFHHVFNGILIQRFYRGKSEINETID
jgi:predicted Na+-dependent transporter